MNVPNVPTMCRQRADGTPDEDVPQCAPRLLAGHSGTLTSAHPAPRDQDKSSPLRENSPTEPVPWRSVTSEEAGRHQAACGRSEGHRRPLGSVPPVCPARPNVPAHSGTLPDPLSRPNVPGALRHIAGPPLAGHPLAGRPTPPTHKEDTMTDTQRPTLGPTALRTGCDVPDCDRPHRSRGLCARHYHQARRADPEVAQARREAVRRCRQRKKGGTS